MQFQVEDVHDQERCAIEQDHVAPDQYVLTVRWRRREVVFHILGAPLHFPSQPGRQSSAHNQLALQARRESIAFG